MRTVVDYIIMLIGTLGSLASIVTILLLFDSLQTEGWIAVIFMGVISIYFVIYNFHLLGNQRKKTHYADAYAEINIGFSRLHRLRRIEDVSIEQIVPEMDRLCDSVSQAFGRLYNERIGVCIKYIVSDNNRPRVETLARDAYSKTCGRPTGSSDNTKHWIDANSDFEFIYANYDDDNQDTSYYLERHLPICKDYKNTRLKDKWKPKHNMFFLENWYRRHNWPLKYKSTLVVPIVPLIADEQSQSVIRGFLCADSPKEGNFNSTYDVDIMKGVCDGLYNQIDQIYKLNQQKRV